jgi:polyisoprenoid-binding protein YceI
MKLLKLFIFIWISNNIVAQTYTPTDVGSKVHFIIKNFGVKTGGDFTGLKGSIIFNPTNLAASQFNVSVSSSSINTDNNSRDRHLKKADYFNVDKFPEITIVSTKISESTNNGRYYFAGSLTIKGVTKPIQFGFGATLNSTGYLFTGEFEINRRDFGVGGSSISLNDRVKINLSINAKK